MKPKIVDADTGLPRKVGRPRKKAIPLWLVGKGFQPGAASAERSKIGKLKHSALRDEIQHIAGQLIEAKAKVGSKEIVVLGTRLQFLILDMFHSGDARDHQLIMEHGYGKVAEQLDLQVSKQIHVTLKLDRGDNQAQLGEPSEVPLTVEGLTVDAEPVEPLEPEEILSSTIRQKVLRSAR